MRNFLAGNNSDRHGFWGALAGARFRCRSRTPCGRASADFSSADICSAKPPAVPEAVKRHRKPPEGRVLQGFHEPPPKSVTVIISVCHRTGRSLGQIQLFLPTRLRTTVDRSLVVGGLNARAGNGDAARLETGTQLVFDSSCVPVSALRCLFCLDTSWDFSIPERVHQEPLRRTLVLMDRRVKARND